MKILLNKQVAINVIKGVGLVMSLVATVIDQTTKPYIMRQEIAKEVQKQLSEAITK